MNILKRLGSVIKLTLVGDKNRSPVIYLTAEHKAIAASAYTIWYCLMVSLLMLALCSSSLVEAALYAALFVVGSLTCARVVATGVGLANALCRLFGVTRLFSATLIGEAAVASIRPLKFKLKDGQELLVKTVNIPVRSGQTIPSPMHKMYSAIESGDRSAAAREAAVLSSTLGPPPKAMTYQAPSIRRLKEIVAPLKQEAAKGQDADIPRIVNGVLSNCMSLQLGYFESRKHREIVDSLSLDLHSRVYAKDSKAGSLARASFITTDEQNLPHTGELLGKTASVFTLAELFHRCIARGHEIFAPIKDSVDVRCKIGEVGYAKEKWVDKPNFDFEFGQVKLARKQKLNDII